MVVVKQTSWQNDFGSLGRPTAGVLNPDNPDELLEPEVLETQPALVMRLVEQDFRAVDIATGDCVSVALGEDGQLRVWGAFRVSVVQILIFLMLLTNLSQSVDGTLGFDGQPGTPRVQIEPLSLPSLQQHQFVALACGTDHVVSLTSTGHVYVWGNGQLAQLGRKIIEVFQTFSTKPT
jgi:regulator of chromosome condensation